MNGPALLMLQQIDSELDALNARRQRLAEKVAVTEATQARTRIERDATRERELIAAAVASIEAGEHAAAEIDRHRTRLEAQLKTVIAPREAEALMHEIATLNAKRSAVDDAELEAMQQQADADEVLVVLGGEAAAADERLAEAQRALDAVLAVMASDEAAIRERRAAADAEIDDAGRSFYAATLARHGGVGFCRIEGRSCTGCHVDISPGELDTIRHTTGDDLPECPNCARLLVL